MEVKISGLNNLLIKLSVLDSRLDNAMDEALNEIAEKIRDDAKNFVPVDTGALQKSIRVEKKRRLEVSVVAGGGGIINPKSGREVNYAGYVEFGTSRMRAQPYMQPALEKNMNGIPRIIKRKVEEALR